MFKVGINFAFKKNLFWVSVKYIYMYICKMFAVSMRRRIPRDQEQLFIQSSEICWKKNNNIALWHRVGWKLGIWKISHVSLSHKWTPLRWSMTITPISHTYLLHHWASKWINFLGIIFIHDAWRWVASHFYISTFNF